jgi:hypothetical protein
MRRSQSGVDGIHIVVGTRHGRLLKACAARVLALGIVAAGCGQAVTGGPTTATARSALMPSGPDGVTFRMTTVDLGGLNQLPPFSVRMSLESHFDGALFPPAGEVGPVFWCDDQQSSGSAGPCVLNGNTWAYPDPETNVCPPAGTTGNIKCVGSETTARFTEWMRSVPFDPAGPPTVRIDVVMHVQEGLFELSFGEKQVDARVRSAPPRERPFSRCSSASPARRFRWKRSARRRLRFVRTETANDIRQRRRRSSFRPRSSSSSSPWGDRENEAACLAASNVRDKVILVTPSAPPRALFRGIQKNRPARNPRSGVLERRRVL